MSMGAPDLHDDVSQCLEAGRGAVLVFAASGLGKSTLAAARPEVVADTDVALDAALADAFPEAATVRERRRAWRALAGGRPWADPASDAWRLWSRTRVALHAHVRAMLESERPRLVLTNLLDIGWRYSRYYGLALGGFAQHWAGLAREVDNGQSEADSRRLSGYAPLLRLQPGVFLNEDKELLAEIERLVGASSASNGDVPMSEKVGK